MKSVSKSTLKARMFEFLRLVESSGESLIVTDFGKPVLQISPLNKGRSLDELFSDLQGKARLSREAVLDDTSDEWPKS